MNRLLILAIIFAPSSLLAEQSNDELAKLRESYKKAMERATAPISATYVSELKKLMEKRTKAGNLDGALAVKAELAALDGATASPSATVSKPTVPQTESTKANRLTRADQKAIEARIVDKYWTYADGRADGFHFSKDGTGLRYQGIEKPKDFKWRLEEDGSILIFGSGSGKRLTTRSDTEGEMIFGEDGTGRAIFKTAAPPPKSTNK